MMLQPPAGVDGDDAAGEIAVLHALQPRRRHHGRKRRLVGEHADAFRQIAVALRILRDTPVDQLAVGSATVGGATLRSNGAAGLPRLYLRAHGQRFIAWNPQGQPTDLDLALPGGGRVRTDGLVGLARWTVDLAAGSLAIDQQPTPGQPAIDPTQAASVVTISGWTPRTITVNGAAVPASGVIPLVKQPRDATTVTGRLAILDAARTAWTTAAPAQLFTHVWIGARGSELAPQTLDRRTWSNYGAKERHVPAFVTPAYNGGDPFLAVAGEGKPAYHLAVPLRTDAAREVFLSVDWRDDDEQLPAAVQVWVDGVATPISPPDAANNRFRGVARLKLAKSGVHLIVIGIRQPATKGRCLDSLELRLGEPLFGLPSLPGTVQVQDRDGAWIPANLRVK
jgi:hypothetical protein